MAVYPQNLTLAGYDVPRVFVCGNNLVCNSGFENDLTNWDTLPGVTTSFSRYAAGTSTYFGDYVLQLSGVSISDVLGARTPIVLPQPCEQDPANSGNLTNKRFLLSWYDFAISGATYHVQVVASDESKAVMVNGNTAIGAVSGQGRKVATVTFNTSVQRSFYIYFYAGLSTSALSGATFFIDQVECREIIQDITAREVDNFSFNWDEVVQSEYQMLDGSIKHFKLGRLFRATLGYNYISATEERDLRDIANGATLVVMPHKDKYYFVDCVWDVAYDTGYFGNIMAGHVGKMTLKGIRPEKIIPRTFVTATTNI